MVIEFDGFNRPAFGFGLDRVKESTTNLYAIDLNPKTKMIYLANVFSDYGSLLNGTTNSLSGTIPLGTSERDVAVISKTNMIYPTNYEPSTVSIINATTNKVTVLLLFYDCTECGI